MARSRNVTPAKSVTPAAPSDPEAIPSPEAVGKALALRRMLDAVEPHAVEARRAVRAAQGHENHACAEATAKTLETSVARLKEALREGGLFA